MCQREVSSCLGAKTLPLYKFEYFLQSMGKLLYNVVCDPVLKFCAFKPGDPDMNIAFTCIMSQGRILNLVPKLNLHEERKSILIFKR